ncbi:MAG: diaminopimelate decarboxylase [Planctomycetota bacterium]|nr:MAG: diaminopimelate decarboxylase [Planctomycetota bacterium]
MSIESLKFLSSEQVLSLASEFGTPCFVYDQSTLIEKAKQVLAFPNAFGLTARYAMKACPNIAVVKTLTNQGLHIDASSEFEVYRALKAGISGDKIQLTAQEHPADFSIIIDNNVFYNACSIEQIKQYGKANPGGEISIRVNPGMGSGSTNRTNVGGPASSFGIWYEQLDEAIATAKEHQLKITKMHTHIGSGSDPEVWKKVALMSLETVSKIDSIHTLNLGGGYKVARMQEEVATDLQICGEPVKEEFEKFAEETGRQLHLEIEPGTYLVANSGAILTTVVDKINTGKAGYNFLKIDCGMTEVTRPSLYGAQQPIISISKVENRNTEEYIIAGHCCESGDILTPAPGDPEKLQPRELSTTDKGDFLVIEGSGAYCAGMSTKNYNSFPEAAEILIDAKNKEAHLVRKRQTLDQIIQNEILPEFI